MPVSRRALLAVVCTGGVNANEASVPCDPEGAFGHFDFWVGDWEVFVASGEKAGDNTITKEQEWMRARRAMAWKAWQHRD